MFFHDIIIFVFYLDPFFVFTVHIVLTKIISTNFCQDVFCRYFRRFFTSIRTRSFTLIKPFPPSGLIKHNLSTSAFGCITPHIVNNFLFFWSNHSISPFVQPIIPTIYMITDTALNLIVVIMFPPLSLDLNIFLTHLIYFFLAFFCISSCFALSASKIHHCVKPVQMRSFFWSLFSRILTEYEEIQSTFPYSVRMRENSDQKKLRIWKHFTQCLDTCNDDLLQYILLFVRQALLPLNS